MITLMMTDIWSEVLLFFIWLTSKIYFSQTYPYYKTTGLILKKSGFLLVGNMILRQFYSSFWMAFTSNLRCLYQAPVLVSDSISEPFHWWLFVFVTIQIRMKSFSSHNQCLWYRHKLYKCHDGTNVAAGTKFCPNYPMRSCSRAK